MKTIALVLLAAILTSCTAIVEGPYTGIKYRINVTPILQQK